jgi:hypothetical protein
MRLLSCQYNCVCSWNDRVIPRVNGIQLPHYLVENVCRSHMTGICTRACYLSANTHERIKSLSNCQVTFHTHLRTAEG